jgi:regulatory protein YycI of two-component signal transduction system YycFG
MKVPFSKFVEVAFEARIFSINQGKNAFFSVEDNVIRNDFDEDYTGDSIEIVNEETGDIVLFGENENEFVSYDSTTEEFVVMDYDRGERMSIWFDSAEKML